MKAFLPMVRSPVWPGGLGLLLALGLGRAATNPPVSFDSVTNTEIKGRAAYVLNVQDKLAYYIENDPVKSAEPEIISVNALGEAVFRISRGSDIAFTLKVKGRTIEDVRAEIKRRLDADYYQDAKVRMDLKESVAKFGSVLFIGRGSRGNMLQLGPGEDKRIFEAVYQVGVSEFADLRKVKLTRVDPATQKTETFIIDLEEIRKGDRTKNILLQNGDIIDVSERSFMIR